MFGHAAQGALHHVGGKVHQVFHGDGAIAQPFDHANDLFAGFVSLLAELLQAVDGCTGGADGIGEETFDAAPEAFEQAAGGLYVASDLVPCAGNCVLAAADRIGKQAILAGHAQR